MFKKHRKKKVFNAIEGKQKIINRKRILYISTASLAEFINTSRTKKTHLPNGNFLSSARKGPHKNKVLAFFASAEV